MGPSFEFSDFRQYINLQGCFEKIPFVFAIKSALIELSKSLLNILSVLFLLKKFDFNYCLTEEYANKLYDILYNKNYHMDLEYVKQFNSEESVIAKYNEFFKKLLK